MTFPKNGNSHPINDLIRTAVRAQTRCGQNYTGATETLADWLMVTPKTICLRERDLVTGAPRRPNLTERCWAFLDHLVERQRIWLEGLSRDVEDLRKELQITLPLEAGENGAGISATDARRVLRAENDVAVARVENAKAAARVKALK